MNKKTALIGIGVAVVAIIGVVIFIVMSLGGGGKSNTDSKGADNSSQASSSGKIDTTGLVKADEKTGNGSAVKDGDTVSINYVLTLQNGKKVDSSYDRKVPFEFKVGGQGVIGGMSAGVIGMKVGGKRKLTIPPNLGYGAQGAGKVVPPNSTLIFEVELLSIK